MTQGQGRDRKEMGTEMSGAQVLSREHLFYRDPSSSSRSYKNTPKERWEIEALILKMVVNFHSEHW